MITFPTSQHKEDPRHLRVMLYLLVEILTQLVIYFVVEDEKKHRLLRNKTYPFFHIVNK